MNWLKVCFLIFSLYLVSIFSKNAIAVNRKFEKENVIEKTNYIEELSSSLSGNIKEISKLPDYLINKNDNNKVKDKIIVRVELKIINKFEIEIFSKYGFFIINKDNEKIYEIKGNKSIFLENGKLYIENLEIENGLEVYPCYNSMLSINKNRYRGNIKIFNNKNEIQVINNVDLEEYLYGVIGREVPTDWSLEALKAQAIASRSYVLYRIKENKNNKLYDVKSTAAAQRYGGYDYEIPKTNKAVDLTKNTVLIYGKNRLVAAYYHSNSGGFTEDDINLWNNNYEKPYLLEIQDNFSLDCPQENWQYFFTGKSIRNLLGRFYYNIGDIINIVPNKLSKFGRVIELKIIHTNGELVISGNQFRNRIGSWKIRSTLFKVERAGEKYIFIGKGFGHGVGMSQWGSKKMADAGYNHEQILKYYYIDTELSRYRKNLML